MLRLALTLLAASLSLTAAAVAGAASGPSLTGSWHGDGGVPGTYTITQSGNTVTWAGQADDGHSWANDYKGSIVGSDIAGSFQDRPGFDVYQHGEVRVHIVDACHLTFVSASVGWGTQTWTRTPCPAAAPATPAAPGRLVYCFSVNAVHDGYRFGELIPNEPQLRRDYHGTLVHGCGKLGVTAGPGGPAVTSAQGRFDLTNFYVPLHGSKREGERIAFAVTGASLTGGPQAQRLVLQIHVLAAQDTACRGNGTLTLAQSAPSSIALALCGLHWTWTKGKTTNALGAVSFQLSAQS